MNTYHLHIQGRVQGVGFRPHVYRLARSMGLCGWVSNGLDGVHIQLRGSETDVQQFCDELIGHPPDRAIITSWKKEETVAEICTDFQIIESSRSGQANLLLTPDLGICEECRKELWDHANRRFHYAFTTCTNCGPRYSIIDYLPYDREYTSMYEFSMCPACFVEYHNPEERRHFSQTNSCPRCAVHLLWQDKEGRLGTDAPEKALSNTIRALRQGKIVAVKGIGGFLLMADATNGKAVQDLRSRKHRPTKPFALLYPNVEMLKKDVLSTPAELDALQSIESPIVLFRVRTRPDSNLALKEIAPGLDTLGVMLPYTPLFELLAQAFGKPLVATSGNFSGSPIYFEDEDAVQYLGPVVDSFLTNDRRIVVPQDDSVLRFSERQGLPVFLRRSRGYAPSLLHPAFKAWSGNYLAMGAMLKSTFALNTQKNTYVSQYLGNSGNFDVQESYQHTLLHILKLFGVQVEMVLGDHHPDYFSSQYGVELARHWGVPFRDYQHHRAHFAAVLAENNLLESKEPVLGVIWDGTGLGDDRQVWGGEFFRFADQQMERVAHLNYFDHLFGDKMSLEPRLSALSLLGPEILLQQKFSKQEWNVYQQKTTSGTRLKSSSMGRLFDAVASILGLCDRMSFEGEAAMYLEKLARRHIRRKGIPAEAYLQENPMNWKPILDGILSDLKKQIPLGAVAAKFHLSLVKMVRKVAQKQGLRQIAFSGGVFQNTLLVDLLVELLEPEFELFFHRQLSPNDENISFGQLACFYMEERGLLKYSLSHTGRELGEM